MQGNSGTDQTKFINGETTDAEKMTDDGWKLGDHEKRNDDGLMIGEKWTDVSDETEIETVWLACPTARAQRRQGLFCSHHVCQCRPNHADRLLLSTCCSLWVSKLT